jgi:glycosyltransferase involved in cell wall biosynthesis
MSTSADAATAAGSSSTAHPAVTAIVATRDRPELLARAVAAILGQDYPGTIECIVVFDQSDPAPIDVAVPDGRSLSLIRNTQTPGLAGGRNSGILSATGELIAFCDDDDEWLPPKLTRQVATLMDNPDAVLVGCGLVLVQEDRETIAPAPMKTVTLADLVRSRVWELHPSTFVAWRRAVRDEIGLVDEAIPGSYAEDYEWLLRAARISPIPMVDEPLARIRWHRASYFTRGWQKIIDALTYLLDKHPEFNDDPIGRSRITGQIAFALAASKQGPAARRMARTCVHENWRERRAYLAVLVSLRLLSADFVLKAAHSRGSGI